MSTKIQHAGSRLKAPRACPIEGPRRDPSTVPNLLCRLQVYPCV